MDEIEFEEIYKTAADSTSRITAPETKTAVALCLQLIRGLRDQIVEMQAYEESDEC